MRVNEVTDNQFEDIISSEKKIIVKYYADWCGSCKLFSPKYKRLSGDERFAEVVFLDVNAEENEVARRMAQVDNLPYFAVFKDGQLVEGTSTSLENVVLELLEKLN